MQSQLQKKATPTTISAIRDYIRACGKPAKTLTRELNLNVGTVRKLCGRDSNQFGL